MKLKVYQIQALKPESKVYRRSDGRGLSLEIQPSGSKFWRFRYRWLGKATMLSLGEYPEVSLAEARDKLSELRKQIDAGINPAQHRRDQQALAREAAANSFECVAKEWMDTHTGDKAPRTREKIQLHLGYAIDKFGKRPIAEIKPLEVLALLKERHKAGQLETAHRIKTRCSQVFLYAVATGRCDSDPVASLRGALPSAKVTHRPAVTAPEDVAALLRSLHGYVGQPATCAALKLLPLLFLRSGELRMAKWSEIDLQAAEWRIPAQTGRTKFKTGEHWVPLAPQAVAILTDLQAITGRCRHVFPSIRHGSKSMSANTVNAALRSLGYDSDTMCGHGFRALASTRLNEMGFHPDVIERQLGHKEQDQVRAAYDRAQHRDSRRQMMLAWADYLDKLREGSAVQNSMTGGRQANS